MGKGSLMQNREHVLQMAKSQNDVWGLGYIDLYLMHFPVPQTYVDPEYVRYPVGVC